MKRLILMITVIAVLSGCGVFNKVFKHKAKESTLEQSSSSGKFDTNTKIIDNSVTTITEKLDTTIKTPAVKGQGKQKVNLEDLKEGFNTLDDQFLNLFQIYDSKDSSLKTAYTLKPQGVKVPKERKTEIRNDVKTDKQERAQTKQDVKKEAKKVDVIVDRKADYKVIFIIIAVICVTLLVGWIIKRNFFVKNKL